MLGSRAGVPRASSMPSFMPWLPAGARGARPQTGRPLLGSRGPGLPWASSMPSGPMHESPRAAAAPGAQWPAHLVFDSNSDHFSTQPTSRFPNAPWTHQVPASGAGACKDRSSCAVVDAQHRSVLLQGPRPDAIGRLSSMAAGRLVPLPASQDALQQQRGGTWVAR